jgi:hypothetical protein
MTTGMRTTDDVEPGNCCPEEPLSEATLRKPMDFRAELIEELGRLGKPDLQRRLQECGNAPGAKSSSDGCGLFVCPDCEARDMAELAPPVERFLDALDRLPLEKGRYFISMTLSFEKIPARFRYSQDGWDVLRPVCDCFQARFIQETYRVPSDEDRRRWVDMPNGYHDKTAGALFSPTFRKGKLCYQTLLWFKLGHEYGEPRSLWPVADMWTRHSMRDYEVKADLKVDYMADMLWRKGNQAQAISDSHFLSRQLLLPATFTSPREAAELLTKMPSTFLKFMPVGEFGGHAGLLSI